MFTKCSSAGAAAMCLFPPQRIAYECAAPSPKVVIKKWTSFCSVRLSASKGMSLGWPAGAAPVCSRVRVYCIKIIIRYKIWCWYDKLHIVFTAGDTHFHAPDRRLCSNPIVVAQMRIIFFAGFRMHIRIQAESISRRFTFEFGIAKNLCTCRHKCLFFIVYCARFGSVQSQKPDLIPQCLSCEA